MFSRKSLIHLFKRNNFHTVINLAAQAGVRYSLKNPDAFWENNLNLWDIASGVLLVIEAGGNISEPNGIKWQKDSRNVLASNALIHKDMINCLKL